MPKFKTDHDAYPAWAFPKIIDKEPLPRIISLHSYLKQDNQRDNNLINSLSIFKLQDIVADPGKLGFDRKLTDQDRPMNTTPPTTLKGVFAKTPPVI